MQDSRRSRRLSAGAEFSRYRLPCVVEITIDERTNQSRFFALLAVPFVFALNTDFYVALIYVGTNKAVAVWTGLVEIRATLEGGALIIGRSLDSLHSRLWRIQCTCCSTRAANLLLSVGETDSVCTPAHHSVLEHRSVLCSLIHAV